MRGEEEVLLMSALVKTGNFDTAKLSNTRRAKQPTQVIAVAVLESLRLFLT